jgi:hypothetical protein
MVPSDRDNRLAPQTACGHSERIAPERFVDAREREHPAQGCGPPAAEVLLRDDEDLPAPEVCRERQQPLVVAPPRDVLAGRVEQRGCKWASLVALGVMVPVVRQRSGDRVADQVHEPSCGDRGGHPLGDARMIRGGVAR